MNRQMRRISRKIIPAASLLFLAFGIFFCFSNLLIIKMEAKNIADDDQLKDLNADCILILGAGVWEGGVPSNMLADRLEAGLKLYRRGISGKILVSGDHGSKDYDEVNVMKKYLRNGAFREKIFSWIMQASLPMKACTVQKKYSG